MRHLLTFALILVFASSALAVDIDNVKPIKETTTYAPQDGGPDRDGGDTIETATTIAALPFNDSASTVGFNHDYDEVCNYSGSLSPDVVYAFTATAAALVNIDLNGSSYDTKVYVYENVYTPGAPYACNDDFYSDYTSLIEGMAVNAGNTYFIVIDGYGSGSGTYILNITEFSPPEPCIVVCDGVDEGEPSNGPDYVDNFNGGCNSEPQLPPQEITADEYGNLNFCGVGGWTGTGKDTDWFSITLGASGSATCMFETEIPSWFFTLTQDCASVAIIDQWTVAECEPTVINFTGAPGDIVWLWVGAQEYTPPSGFVGYNFNYSMGLSGLQPGVVATDNTSFGAIKSMYR